MISAIFSANCGSRERLKLRTRCGWSWCAAQMRCTERERHGGGVCHGSPGPIRGPRGRLATRERHDVRHFIGRDRSFAGLARLVTQQPVGTFLGKTLLPAPDHGAADADLFRHMLHRPTTGRGQNDWARSMYLPARLRSDAIALSRFLSAALNNTHTVCAMLTKSHGNRML